MGQRLGWWRRLAAGLAVSGAVSSSVLGGQAESTGDPQTPESGAMESPHRRSHSNPAAAEAHSVPAPSPSLTWRGEWRGWDGFHFDLQRRTLIGRWVPDLTNIPPVRPHLWSRTPDGATIYHVDLANTRMAGKIGSKLAVDAAAFQADDTLGDFDGGAELRRARVYARGDCQIVLPVSYEVEIGYLPNEFFIENSYLEFQNLGSLGSLKAGQYQTPMTLENVASSRDRTFMETPAPLQALAPGIEAGLQVGRPILRQRMTWAVGLFTEGVGYDVGDATKDFGRAVIRITGLPIDRPGNSASDRPRLWHLGLSGYGLYAGADSVRYQSRPESHLAPHVIDTGTINADGAFVLGTEIAWVEGPFSVQAESLHAWTAEASNAQVAFNGFYLSASWFPSGETRPYDRTRGAFGRVIPDRELAPGKGAWGAWEIATRFSYLDLNSNGIRGGRLAMGMAGVNWYLYSHLKWRFDVGFGRASGGPREGAFSIFQSRLEIDF